MSLVAGHRSVGLSAGAPLYNSMPPDLSGRSTDEQVAYLLQKVEQMQTILEGKADAARIKTHIAYSDEAIKIQAQDIVLVGEVTIAQIIKEQNGTTSGTVNATITRIVGNRIQTGTIYSNNWGTGEGTAIDLDQSKIWMGGSSAPKFYYDGAGNLEISGTITAGSVIAGSVTVGGVTLTTISARALAGFNIQQQLEVSGTTILAGVIQPTNTGAIAVGTITWNSSTGALTGGTGVALTEWGIIGASGGSAKFTIEASTGNANFAGTVTAGAIIAGSVTIGSGAGETITSVQSNAQAGYNLSQALTVSGTTILRGVLQPDNTGAVAVGTITWNATTGALTGGTGIAMTEWGIIGAASGTAKFTIEASTGNANFAGTVTAGAVITNSVTVDGVTLGTISAYAAAGNSLNTALTVSGTTVLRGVIQPDNTGAVAIGTITWNSSTGALTGGTGIAITEWGLIGASSGSAKFTIEASTGNATFAGSLSAATGTFAGSLSAATGTFSGSISAASGTFTGSLVTSGQIVATGQNTSGGIVAAMHAVPSSGGLAVYANSGSSTSPTIQIDHTGASGFGLLCQAATYGIFASATTSGGAAIYAIVTGSATVALSVNGLLTIDNSTLVTNLNADKLDGYHLSQIGFNELMRSTTWVKVQTSADGVTPASSIYVRLYDW